MSVKSKKSKHLLPISNNRRSHWVSCVSRVWVNTAFYLNLSKRVWGTLCDVIVSDADVVEKRKGTLRDAY